MNKTQKTNKPLFLRGTWPTLTSLSEREPPTTPYYTNPPGGLQFPDRPGSRGVFFFPPLRQSFSV